MLKKVQKLVSNPTTKEKAEKNPPTGTKIEEKKKTEIIQARLTPKNELYT